MRGERIPGVTCGFTRSGDTFSGAHGLPEDGPSGSADTPLSHRHNVTSSQLRSLDDLATMIEYLRGCAARGERPTPAQIEAKVEEVRRRCPSRLRAFAELQAIIQGGDDGF